VPLRLLVLPVTVAVSIPGLRSPHHTGSLHAYCSVRSCSLHHVRLILPFLLLPLPLHSVPTLRLLFARYRYAVCALLALRLPAFHHKFTVCRIYGLPLADCCPTWAVILRCTVYGGCLQLLPAVVTYCVRRILPAYVTGSLRLPAC